MFFSEMYGTVYFNKLLPFNIKSIVSVQKIHIIELYACVLKIFVVIFQLPLNILIPIIICSI